MKFLALVLPLLLQGCVLPLATEIYDPEVNRLPQSVRLRSGKIVQQLIAKVRLKQRFDREEFAALDGYGCGSDMFTGSVGAGEVTGDTATMPFLVEQIANGNPGSYSMIDQPFDVCLRIVLPGFLSRRESNSVRIPASEISKLIDRP